jgi:hypothetical protein
MVQQHKVPIERSSKQPYHAGDRKNADGRQDDENDKVN